MTIRSNESSAIVLCGGKSLRAGFDKQTICIEGNPIAEWIADALSRTFSEVILVTNQPTLYDSVRYCVTEDLIPNMGPLGGIHAGLTYCKNDFALVTACDMPNICHAYLRLLKKEAEKGNGEYDAIAVRLDNGMVEPMNALYARRTLPQIEQMLFLGERKTSDLLRRLKMRYLSEDEIKPFGERARLFLNMNTPDEIQSYFAQVQAQESE